MNLYKTQQDIYKKKVLLIKKNYRIHIGIARYPNLSLSHIKKWYRAICSLSD